MSICELETLGLSAAAAIVIAQSLLAIGYASWVLFRPRHRERTGLD